MTRKRLGITFFSHIVLCVLAVNLAFSPEIHAQNNSPVHKIVSLDSSAVPEWKYYWDLAREKAQQGNFQESAEFYEKLFQEKTHVQEAKWEYSKVLYNLEQFSKASMLLEALLEDSPNNDNYLSLAGYVALETAEYSRAVRYLGQVYSSMPEGEDGVHALKGLIKGLKELGKTQYVFVLMEQLRQRTPNDRTLLLDLARTASELGNVGKADDYYSSLVYSSEADDEILQEAAGMYSANGLTDKAVPIWELLVKRHPDVVDYHRLLFEYYKNSGARGKALPYLLALVEKEGDVSPDLYLETARMYLYDEQRADKSLKYYEKYLLIIPHDEVAAEELFEARTLISENLLAIVENDGAEPLWQDLQQFTDNRLIIYQMMAEKLRKSKKVQPLIQIEEILFINTTGSRDDIALRLVDLFLTIPDYHKAYFYLLKVTANQYFTFDYYRQKAEIEIQLGYDLIALESLLHALSRRPYSKELQRECIILAGQLGSVSELKRLGRAIDTQALNGKSKNLYFDYLDALRINGQYSVADSLYAKLLASSPSGSRFHHEILLHKAVTEKMMGMVYESQKEMRMMIAAGRVTPEVISELIDFSLESGEISDGWALFDFYNKQSGNSLWKSAFDKESWRLFRSYIRLLSKDGDTSTALDELSQYRSQIGDESSVVQLAQIRSEVDLELCRLYLLSGQGQMCTSEVQQGSSGENRDYNSILILELVSTEGSISADALRRNMPELRKRKGGVRELFTLAEYAQSLGYVDAAFNMLAEVSKVYPDSMRARVKKANLLKNTGRYSEASLLYWQLWQEYPLEAVFYHDYLQMEFKLGHYERVLTDLNTKPFQALPIDLQLLKTRTMWDLNERSQAFSYYEVMLSPATSETFKKLLDEKNIRYKWKKKKKQAFWDVFRYEEPDQLEKLNALQGDKGFLSIATTPLGEVTAELFDTYRWQELIGNEYKIRKAVDEKKYIAAEKQFRKNIEKEQNTEGLKDLAKIYERLGDYDKEAEVYNYLEKHGEKTPELEQSIERNKVARAPIVSMDATYLERKGRGGQINIQKNSLGTGLRYLPGLNTSLELEAEKIFYDSASGDSKSLDGMQFNSKITYKFHDQTSVEIDLGLHNVNSGGSSTPIYALRLNQQFDQLLSGYVQFDQQIIDDTLESLRQSLDTNSIAAGIVLEGPSGINLGGEFQRIWYDDDNDQNRLFFWSSYTIFSELTTYELKYSYELLNNKDGGTATGQQSNLPYWSPSEYWLNLLSVRIDRVLRDVEELSSPPSHYSVELALGYESEDDFLYTAGFDIFLEISSNFLLKGELSYSDSSDYEEKSAALSIMYRW